MFVSRSGSLAIEPVLVLGRYELRRGSRSWPPSGRRGFPSSCSSPSPQCTAAHRSYRAVPGRAENERELKAKAFGSLAASQSGLRDEAPFSRQVIGQRPASLYQSRISCCSRGTNWNGQPFLLKKGGAPKSALFSLGVRNKPAPALPPALREFCLCAWPYWFRPGGGIRAPGEATTPFFFRTSRRQRSNAPWPLGLPFEATTFFFACQRSVANLKSKDLTSTVVTLESVSSNPNRIIAARARHCMGHDAPRGTRKSGGSPYDGLEVRRVRRVF